MTTLSVFGAILALGAFILHWRYVRATHLARPWSYVADAVLVSMWALSLIGIGSGEVFDPDWARVPAFIGLTWLAVVMYLLLGTLVIGAVTLGIRLVMAARRRESAPLRLRVTRAGSAVVAIGAVIAVGYGTVEATHPQVTETTVVMDRLPSEFDGIRIALVSDLHAGPSRGSDFVQSVVDQVNVQSPDLVVLDGDLTDGTVDLVGSDLAPLQRLSAPLGVFGVSGNHEFYAGDGGKWLDLWDSLGVTVLRNEHRTIDRAGASIDVAGINDATAPAPFEPNLAAALDGRDAERFVLLLAHQPLQVFEASKMGVDFQVSGHTHAGQIWPLRYLVPLQQPTVEGLDTIENTTVYTTRGAGTWGPPVRVAAPPEISMLQLVSS
ncbi:metallophosphoesterase [Rhodococcoides yunnanense]|jgi:predicted MPP superfamily phosphohydrolase|uniref:metallophosphoesterase n=1 Tax=Rhodococcoides yunnanense TaxID=278209 RepID=UPI0022B0A9D3|nr:metallophosphoesterase [Rhodococcus yunnanensis]MCZ4275437.1 metallophosphoesterase [Rhodococcus yunnanensis]